MTALEQEERQFEYPSFTALECEVLSACWHVFNPILIITGILHGFPLTETHPASIETVSLRRDVHRAQY
jgi:hypothetical protein